MRGCLPGVQDAGLASVELENSARVCVVQEMVMMTYFNEIF